MYDTFKLDFDDILILPEYTEINSRKKVNVKVNYRNIGYKGIPLIATNMSTVGTIKMAKALEKMKLMTWLHKFYSADEIYEANLNPGYFAPTFGITDIDNIKRHMDTYDFEYINLDVANAYMDTYLDFVAKIKHMSGKTIIAGTICTPQGVKDLISVGADIIRCGIGSGDHCTTRTVARVGYPQFSALLECSEVTRGYDRCLVCDGGCKNPGDFSAAFVAGANFVSVGSMFSAHYENTDNIIEKDGKQFAEVYGMSSESAMLKYYGKKNNYRSSEGKTSLMPYKGKIKNTIEYILGGIRSTCTYTNSSDITKLQGKQYVRVNNQRNTYYDNYKVGD